MRREIATKLNDAIARLRGAIPQPMRPALRRLRAAATYLPRRYFGVITGVYTEQPAVAITFDDGPHPLYTPRFLRLLERHGARGTFFLLGTSAAKYPHIVRRIKAGGHAVGNHSWDHPSFPAISPDERERQVRECARAIGDPWVKLFRPPYGNQTWSTRWTLRRLGWEVVAWNISGTDWRGADAESIATRIVSSMEPGSIVLLHDALHRYEDERYAARDATLKALAMVLEAGAGRYAFVTVPELLRMGRPRRELWIQPGETEYLAALRGGEEESLAAEPVRRYSP